MMGWTRDDVLADLREALRCERAAVEAVRTRHYHGERPMDAEDWRDYWIAFSPWGRIAQVVRWAAERQR